jgi:predicted nuclease of predicted toxin-antitoxin system
VKFLIDNQLPPALARCIQSELHAEAIHISDVKLQTAGDRDVWNYASTGGWILISKDEDFASIFSRTPTARLLWVRLGNCRRDYLLGRFRRAWPRIIARFASGDLFVELR